MVNIMSPARARPRIVSRALAGRHAQPRGAFGAPNNDLDPPR